MRPDAAVPPRDGRPPVFVEHVTVRPDRIVVDVRISCERYAYTTPQLVREALARFPFLMEHACVNDRGPTFASVACHTSVPHLLEHMAIEEQVRLAGRASASYVGKTAWSDRRALRARVELSYDDDLVALRCIRTAQEWLNETLRRQEAADRRARSGRGSRDS